MELLPVILLGIGLAGIMFVVLIFFVFIRLFTRLFTFISRYTGRSELDRESVLDSKHK